MTIDLTDSQIDQIYEEFDWDEYFYEWLCEDIIEDWLNKNPEYISKYLKYGRSLYTDKYFKDNKEELLEIINGI